MGQEFSLYRNLLELSKSIVLRKSWRPYYEYTISRIVNIVNTASLHCCVIFLLLRAAARPF